MDKDLKKLISETVDQFFEGAPEKMIEQGVRDQYYDVCPHCKKEIYEKNEYTEDGGVTWRHSDCKGLIARPDTPLEEIVSWLRPYVEEAREIRRLQREKVGLKENLTRNDLLDAVDKMGGEIQKYEERLKNKFGLTVRINRNRQVKRVDDPMDPYVDILGQKYDKDETLEIYKNGILINNRRGKFVQPLSKEAESLIDNIWSLRNELHTLLKKYDIDLYEDLPLGGEKKYNKQEPGGIMGAVNTATIGNV